MAQNISIWGANYSNVPGVNLPKQGGGTATFTDVSDTTAAASDVASGKYFYTAAGVRTAGTSSGGGGGIPAPTAGDTAVAAWVGAASTTSTTVTQIGDSIKCPTAGTVTVKASGYRSNTSGTWSAQVYKNGTAVSGATATFSGNTWTLDKDITVAANDVLTIRGRSRGTSYTLWIFDIVVAINWNNGYSVT